MSNGDLEADPQGAARGRFTSDCQPQRPTQAENGSLRRLAEEAEEFDAWAARTGSDDWIEFLRWKSSK